MILRQAVPGRASLVQMYYSRSLTIMACVVTTVGILFRMSFHFWQEHFRFMYWQLVGPFWKSWKAKALLWLITLKSFVIFSVLDSKGSHQLINSQTNNIYKGNILQKYISIKLFEKHKIVPLPGYTSVTAYVTFFSFFASCL